MPNQSASSSSPPEAKPPFPVYIIGVGDDGLEGLSKPAMDLISQAQVLIGTQSLLAKFSTFQGHKEVIGGDLEHLVAFIEQKSAERMVLLANGDPLFYGTSRFLCDRLGKDRFEVLPHVSSMQLAFARVKESWDDAYLTNLATQSLDRAVERIRSAQKVGLFTTETDTPNRIASTLIQRGMDYFHAYVCENLGSPDERVTQGSLADLAKLQFSTLNVMVLIRRPGTPDRVKGLASRRLFGNPDELFLQSRPKRGLVTPAEVRSVALAELELQSDSIVWDVGAGSGSVAIEAALLAPEGTIYAIEMDAEDYGLVTENARRFGVPNLLPIHGEAPTAFQDLPSPDAVFLDGTGRNLRELAQHAWDRLREGGRLIANVVSFENVANLETFLHDECHVEPQVWMIQVSRSNLQLGRSRLESANPTFLVKAVKSHAKP